MSTHQYWPQLDGVRGIAVLAVLLLHGSYGQFPGGFLGVDLFFSLSGFLITTILYQEWTRYQKVRLGQFYARRILRLYPALVVAVVSAIFVWPGSLDPLYWKAASAALFYYKNLVAMPLTPLEHTWSLSIEEQFYILWPPLLIALLPMRKSLRLGIIVAALCASVGVRIGMLHGGASAYAINRFTFARTDSLLGGCAAALWLADRADRSGGSEGLHWIPEIVATGCIVVLCWLFRTADQNQRWLMTWGYTAVAVLCASLVTCAASLRSTSPVSVLLCAPIMRYLGTRSYGLYLYHFLLFPLFEPMRRPHSPANFLLVTILRFALTLMVVELSFRFIERPFMKLKRRFDGGRPERNNDLLGTVLPREV